MARRRGVDAEYRVKTEGASQAEKEVGGIADAFDDLGASLPGPAADIADIGSQFAGGGGLAAAAGIVGTIGAAVGAAAAEFVETAKAAERVGIALETSTEEASRLALAFEQAGVDEGDLIDIALQTTDVLSENAELAETLGVNIEEGVNPAEAIQAAVAGWDLLTPTQRMRLFGEEGVRQVTELIRQGGNLSDIMASFSDAQVIDDAEVAKAREMDNTIRELKATWDAIVLTVGGEGVQAFNDIKVVVDDLGAAFEAVVGPWRDFINGLSGDGEIWDALTSGAFENYGKLRDIITGELTPAISQELVAAAEEAGAAMDEAGAEGEESFDAVALSVSAAEEAAKRLQGQYDAMSADVAADKAWIDLVEKFENVDAAAIEAWNAAEQGSEDAEAKARDYEKAQLDLKDAVIDYGSEIAELPPEVVTDILADIDEGSVQEARSTLDGLERQRVVPVRVEVSWTNPGGGPTSGSSLGIPRSTSAGVDLASAAAQQSSSAPAVSNTSSSRNASGLVVTAAPMQVTVNLPAASQGRDVVRSIRRWERVNGGA